MTFDISRLVPEPATPPAPKRPLIPYVVPVEDLSKVDDDDDIPEDNGTMPGNVEYLAEKIVGHRIVSAEQTSVKKTEFDDAYGYTDELDGLVLTLDTGRRVLLQNTDDCCAYTDLTAFLLHPERVDHIITGVGTTDGFSKWHIFADFGDVMELSVNWSPGNPFYYAYGFNIAVSDVIDADPEQKALE